MTAWLIRPYTDENLNNYTSSDDENIVDAEAEGDSKTEQKEAAEGEPEGDISESLFG